MLSKEVDGQGGNDKEETNGAAEGSERYRHHSNDDLAGHLMELSKGVGEGRLGLPWHYQPAELCKSEHVTKDGPQNGQGQSNYKGAEPAGRHRLHSLRERHLCQK